MAILEDIRSKSWLLIVLVGLALFMFVASPDDIMRFFNAKKMNSIGSINGEHVTREEFTERVKEFSAANNNTNDSQATLRVWENIISEKIFDEQLEKAGIVIGEKEIWNTIISDPGINNNPMFLNEAGLFDEESLRNYVSETRDDKSPDGRKKWAAWVNYDKQIRQNLERQAYVNAVSAGLGIPLQEAKQEYNTYNTLVTGKFVSLPYTSIADSTITVSDDEIQDYIDAHKNQFKTNATRNLRYVVFNVEASAEDKAAIKGKINGIINDFVEYNNITKTNDTLKGFKNTTDYADFIAEHSDVPFNDNFIFKGTGNDSLFTAPLNTVIGPYEENGYYVMSKVIEKKEVTSARASHILISFKETGNPNAKYTKEEAQALSDQILARIKAGGDFATEATTYSEDPGSASRGGDLNWFREGMMVPQFNDWVFSHNKGDLGIVESAYGYHIIKKTDTKTESGIKVAKVALAIEPSETTVSKAFQVAESFNSKVSKNPNDFAKISKEQNLDVRNADRLGRMSQNIPGLPGINSQIVGWAFESNRKTGDIRRFDLDKSYVIAQLTEMQEQGIMSVKSASNFVKPILIKQKKADILAKKLEKGTLEQLAQANNTVVNNLTEVTFAQGDPVLLGDKAPLGALLSLKPGTIVRGVVGLNAVYAVQLDNKTAPPALNSYQALKYQLDKNMSKDINAIYGALRQAADVGELKLQ